MSERRVPSWTSSYLVGALAFFSFSIGFCLPIRKAANSAVFPDFPPNCQRVKRGAPLLFSFLLREFLRALFGNFAVFLLRNLVDAAYLCCCCSLTLSSNSVGGGGFRFFLLLLWKFRGFPTRTLRNPELPAMFMSVQCCD